jgi:hypothetical protein
MPPGGCTLLEGSHHRYRGTRDEMLERIEVFQIQDITT